MESSIQKCLAFVTVVECGSFTKAAKRLSYSQSGVSRMVADLEGEWKINLLERHRGGVRPTSDGMKMLPFAKRLCEEYENLQVQVDELNGLQSGLIRIATFSSGAALWLPSIIKEFQKAYPNVDYEVMVGDYTEIEQWVLEGRVDCAFLPLPVAPALETIYLARDELLVVMPKDHPLAGAESFPVAALADEPFMLLEKGNGAEVERILRQFDLSPRIRFTTWDDYAIMAMVEKGLGISMLTEMIMRRCPYDIVAKSLDVPAYRDVVLAFRGAASSSLALRRFIEYLPFRAGDEE